MIAFLYMACARFAHEMPSLNARYFRQYTSVAQWGHIALNDLRIATTISFVLIQGIMRRRECVCVCVCNMVGALCR